MAVAQFQIDGAKLSSMALAKQNVEGLSQKQDLGCRRPWGNTVSWRSFISKGQTKMAENEVGQINVWALLEWKISLWVFRDRWAWLQFAGESCLHCIHELSFLKVVFCPSMVSTLTMSTWNSKCCKNSLVSAWSQSDLILTSVLCFTLLLDKYLSKH